MNILKILTLTILLSPIVLYAGTAGPSDDEIWLLIIPATLLILFIGIPPLYRFIVKRISEWRAQHYHSSNSEVFNNGFQEV